MRGETLQALGPRSPLRQRGARRERILATLLFGETRDPADLAAPDADRSLGDAVRRTLEVFDGRELKSANGGIVAAFDLPADAVRCALALRDLVASRGLGLRAAVHTGVIDMRAGDACGTAVQLCRRLVEAAEPGKVVATGVVSELAGGLGFEPRGTVRLRGVPGAVRVFGATESTDEEVGSGRNPSGVWRANRKAGRMRLHHPRRDAG